MSPKQYRSAEVSNRSKQRAIRFDPSIDSALVAASTESGVSINAIVGTLVAEGLEKYYPASSSISYTASPTLATNFSGASLLATSVQNYPQTLAAVRDSFSDAVSQLSGTPVEEDPHA